MTENGPWYLFMFNNIFEKFAMYNFLNIYNHCFRTKLSQPLSQWTSELWGVWSISKLNWAKSVSFSPIPFCPNFCAVFPFLHAVHLCSGHFLLLSFSDLMICSLPNISIIGYCCFDSFLVRWIPKPSSSFSSSRFLVLIASQIVLFHGLPVFLLPGGFHFQTVFGWYPYEVRVGTLSFWSKFVLKRIGLYPKFISFLGLVFLVISISGILNARKI